MLEFIGAKVPKKLLIMVYLCHCKQGERRLARKPVHLNFNYWKRTERLVVQLAFSIWWMVI
jgi:hypothetical protein